MAFECVTCHPTATTARATPNYPPSLPDTFWVPHHRVATRGLGAVEVGPLRWSWSVGTQPIRRPANLGKTHVQGWEAPDRDNRKGPTSTQSTPLVATRGEEPEKVSGREPTIP